MKVFNLFAFRTQGVHSRPNNFTYSLLHCTKCSDDGENNYVISLILFRQTYWFENYLYKTIVWKCPIVMAFLYFITPCNYTKVIEQNNVNYILWLEFTTAPQVSQIPTGLLFRQRASLCWRSFLAKRWVTKFSLPFIVFSVSTTSSICMECRISWFCF